MHNVLPYVCAIDLHEFSLYDMVYLHMRNVFHNTISSYQTVEISYLVATISVQCHFASTSMIINLRYLSVV